MLNHIKSNDNHWTVVIGGQPFQFDHTHANYNELCECVMSGESDRFVELVNTGAFIEDWSEGSFSMRDGFLYYGDEQVANQPTERIIGLIKGGYDHKPMLAYLDNLYQNVSNRAVYESYDWCSHKGLPITEDGMMIGYKGVTIYNGSDITDKNGRTLTEGDMVDKYTGESFRNNVGDTCEMNRRQVSDDCSKGCAAGLHVGTYDYANDWATSRGVVVLVKFNPSDIVSVPTDCDHQKMRVSKYTVLSVTREQLEEEIYDEQDLIYDLDESQSLDGWDGEGITW